MPPQDVFVSYAHVDNIPLPPAAEGWVSILIKTLKVLLAQELGRYEAFSLWMDPKLSGNDPLNEQLLDTVRTAGTMVLIHSTGHRASEWCVREKETFLSVAGAAGASRLFLVERDRVDRAPDLANLRGYRLWAVDSLSDETRVLGYPMLQGDEPLYYAVLKDLAKALARAIQQRRALMPPEEHRHEGQPSAPAPIVAAVDVAPRARILLAEVTDDLDPARDEVRRYLEQQQISVLPNETCYSRTSASEFSRQVDQDLEQCELFVQLLSPFPGKRPPDATQTFVELQLERARQSGKTVLQWREPSLDLKSVRDAAHLQLLEGETVLSVGLEELKNTITSRLFPPPPPPPPPPRPADAGLVFVNAEPGDLPFAQQISQQIRRLGAGYVLPLQQGDPTEVRADLERNLLECDKLVIVYGATTPNWVREQLRYARKVLFRRERELQGLAVYQGPPPPKQALGFELPNQQTIDGIAGINETGLRAFLASGG